MLAQYFNFKVYQQLNYFIMHPKRFYLGTFFISALATPLDNVATPSDLQSREINFDVSLSLNGIFCYGSVNVFIRAI